MGTQFPEPVLSVTVSAVRDLQGGEALYGLWTLFTKCKESLQDGRRLENISWRLWYRELMLLNLERDFMSVDFPDEKTKYYHGQPVQTHNTMHDEKSTHRPLPSQSYPSPNSPNPPHEGGVPPHQSRLSAGSVSPAPSSSPLSCSLPFPSQAHLLTPSSPKSKPRPSLTTSRRNSFRSGTPINVGQIICDMLPSTSSAPGSNQSGSDSSLPLGANFSRRTTSSTISSTTSFDKAHNESSSISSIPSSPSIDVIRPAKCSIPEPPSNLAVSSLPPCLPTPENEEVEPRHDLAAKVLSPDKGLTSPSDFLTRKAAPASILTGQDIQSNNASAQFYNSMAIAGQSLAVKTAYTGPPSPSLSDAYVRAHPGEVEVNEVGLLPSLTTITGENMAQKLSDSQNSSPAAPSITTMFAPSSSTSTGSLEPPKLIVVNPTPNLTPHPTPPATPLLHGTVGPGFSPKSQWLALPEGFTGARQHQLLERIAQQQPHLLGSQMTSLRLPFGPTSNGLKVSGTTASVGSKSNQGMDQLDRSRSASTDKHSETKKESNSSQQGQYQVAQGVLHRLHPVYQPSQLENSASTTPPKYPPHPQTLPRPFDTDDNNSATSKDKANGSSLSSTDSNRSRATSASGQSSSSGPTESSIAISTVPSEEESAATSAKPAAPMVVETHPGVGGLDMASISRARGKLGSLQSMTTLKNNSDRKIENLKARDALGVVAGAAVRDGNGNIYPEPEKDIDNEEEDIPLSPLPTISPIGTQSSSPRGEQRKKRNSAPIPTSTSTLLAMSPSRSAQGSGLLTASPASMTFGESAEKKAAATGALMRRTSSTSRTGSSGTSRSRSREAGVGAGLGMSTVHHPLRKTGVVVGGRGRSKVTLARPGAKKGAMRRNSAGTTSTGAANDVTGDDEELDADQMDQELEREREKSERENQERTRVEAMERERLAREQEAAIATEKIEAAKRLEEERQRNREALELTAGATGEPGGSKRPVRFNIGSNSDEGSGMGSKSYGSASDVSGGHDGRDKGTLTSKVNGKEKARNAEPHNYHSEHRQQQQQQQQFLHQQHQGQRNANDQRDLQQQMQRQMSKQQLRQLQAIQQQHQNLTLIQAHHSQQQLQPQQQEHNQLLSSRQVSAKHISLAGRSKEAVETSGQQPKGKDKEVAASKSRRGNSSKATVTLDDDLAAKVKESLAAPLLPQNKRTIVLATSESDYETDSDDGSWSSEEATGSEDREERRAKEEQLRQQLLQQQHRQQQEKQQRQRQPPQPQPPARPAGLQRAPSSHYPAGKNGGKLTREQQRLHAQSMQKAALEAQRQREMFVKLPASSFQNLADARTRSVGLLTQLMNPNPEIFPSNHPYRRGFSSDEIRPGGISGMAPARPLTSVPPTLVDHDTSVAENASRHAHKRQVSVETDAGKPKAGRSTFSPPSRPVGLQRTKSAAAIPVSSSIIAGSISSKAPIMTDLTTTATLGKVNFQPGNSGGYRPRNRPREEDLEDDSGVDEPNNQIPISHSIAEQKLKALAQRSKIQPNAHRNSNLDQPQARQGSSTHPDDDDVPQWAKVSQPEQQHLRTRSLGNNSTVPIEPAKPSPIPTTYQWPYNLPPAAAPTTPRTTRRTMLSTEIPESLRRNLLWERQVSKVNLAGVKRSASGGGGRHSVLGGLQPLTAVPSLVQLHAKGTGPPGSRANDDRAPGRSRRKEDKQREAMARNKSWANDYHWAGW